MKDVDDKPLSAEQIELSDKLGIRHSLADNFHYRDIATRALTMPLPRQPGFFKDHSRQDD